MEEQLQYDTSFRFKWGVGFLIEMLENTLKLSPDLLLTTPYYALEGNVYTYNSTEKMFTESEGLVLEGTGTNFVLKLAKDDFDRMVAFNEDDPAHLKEQLITEFSNTDQVVDESRLTLLHETYDNMPLLDTILTYTNLSLNFPDENTLIIEDPAPQKIDPAYHLV